jgi:hypothetical protein
LTIELKTELLISGYSDDDIEVLLKGINLIRESGHNLLALAAKFSDREKLNSSIRQSQVQISILERNVRQLEEKAKVSEQIIESKSQMQWVMVKLEAMGFGLKQLSRLYNVIKEVTEANGFSETDGYAVKMFLDHVRRNYDPLLDFEKRIEEYRVEFHNLDMQHIIRFW